MKIIVTLTMIISFAVGFRLSSVFPARPAGDARVSMEAREPAAETYFGFSELKARIDRGGARTVEKAISLLPPELLRNYTLMHASKSLQDASPENPRAILFHPSGSTIVTFNGHRTQKGYDALETASIDPRTQAISFREIAFDPEGKSPPRYSEANPAKCMMCHGREGMPRFIWSSYNFWEGAYGQDDDKISNNNNSGIQNLVHPFLIDEKDHFDAFRKAAAQHPRYRHLIAGSKEHAYFPYHRGGPERRMALLPNFRLAGLLATSFGRAIGHEIVTRTNFPAIRYSLLASILCPADPINKTGIERLRSYASIEFPEWSEADLFQNDALNLAIGDLTRFMTFELNPDERIIRQDNYLTGTKFKIPFMVIYSVLENLYREDPTLAEKLLPLDQAFGNRAEIDPEYSVLAAPGPYPEDESVFQSNHLLFKLAKTDPKSGAAMCERLVPLAKTEQLEKLPAVKPRPKEAPTALTGPQILRKHGCIACHSSAEFGIGPDLPFANEEELRSVLKGPASSGLPFLEEIRYRAGWPKKPRPRERPTHAQLYNDHMPRGGGVLTDAELKVLLQYLGGLAR